MGKRSGGPGGPNHGMTAALLIGPSILVLAAVQVYPTLYSFYLSLHRLRGGRFIWAGLENFRRLLYSADFYAALGRTAVFAGVYVACGVGLGLLLAALLRRPTRLSALHITALFIPWVLSDVVAGTMWRWMFQQSYGVVQTALTTLFGAPSLLAHPRWSMAVVIAASVWRTLAFVTLLLLGAMQAVPRETLEAAQVDGATGLSAFFRIILPLIRPTLLVTILISSIRGINALGLILSTTNGGPGSATATASVLLYRIAWQYGDFGHAAALAVLLFGANATLAALYFRTIKGV